MSKDGSGGGSSNVHFFLTSPAVALEALARSFVASQITIAGFRQKLAALPAETPDAMLREMRLKVDESIESWSTTVLPHLVVGFRMALDVLDTYGPEGVRVEDDEFDAALWENKYLVWLRELGGEQPS